jgi:hypothetical protein
VVFDPSSDTGFNEHYDVYKTNYATIYEIFEDDSIDEYSAPNRTEKSNHFSPNLIDCYDTNNSLPITSLTFLNKKIKTSVYFLNFGIPIITFNSKLYGFCFWVDFFIDFTKRLIASNLKGRTYTDDIVSGIGVGTVDFLIDSPVGMMLHILFMELGKTVANFDVTNWYNTFVFFADDDNWDVSPQQDNFPQPKIAFSYGFDDERKKGYEFCEWIASHFNLAIPRNTAGKIDIINLWKNQNDPGTPLEINIEDILQVPGGQRRISIKQTGVDLLYNDVVIKYKRNNSTNEYQAVYIVPDNLQLINPIGGSPNTVSQARDTFYGGKKRTLTIESPFIYNEYDAIRKAQWEINDKAEAKFWVEFYIDYELYDNKSLSAQYKIGDVIALVGKCNGIKFANTEKFIIQDIINCDEGRELCIHAKSNDPVTAFFL